MILTRNDKVVYGIFGNLVSKDNKFSCFTLEHAYPQPPQPMTSPSYAAKIPPGVYTCVRGQHQLKNMAKPFETFEVTNVPGHSNILFHSGNLNADSEGCILLGLGESRDVEVTESRDAFKEFMAYLTGLDQFELTVV